MAVLAAACALALAAGCGSGSGPGPESGTAPTTPTAPAQTTTTATTTTATTTTGPQLPLEVGALDGQMIPAAPAPEWVILTSGTAWVTGVAEGLGRYDPVSGVLRDSTPLQGEACAAPDAGFGALWFATCGTRGVRRVDPATGEVTAAAALPVPMEGGFSVGAGEGGVWVIADADGCRACRLVKLDPRTLDVERRYPVPARGAGVRAGLGSVWVSYPDEDLVRRIDPATGDVVVAIPVGEGPRFLDVGAGAVWVLNATDGTVSRIDPAENQTVARIPVDDFGVQGGDLTVGAGAVWVRATKELVARIDPATDEVTARIGLPGGSGSAAAADGQLWISDRQANQLYRIPLGNLPAG